MIDLAKYDTIFFDYNGTIIDDVDLCLNILNTMLDKRGHNKISKEYYLTIFTFPIIDYYKRAGFIFPQDDYENLAKYYSQEYLDHFYQLKLNNGIKELLESLIKNNKKLYIVSASEINLLLKQLEYFDLKKYFSGIAALDNNQGKSKIEITKQFIKNNHIGLNKALLIGDTLHDEQTSDELNIPCILYSQGHQCKNVLLNGHSIIFDSFYDLKIDI